MFGIYGIYLAHFSSYVPDVKLKCVSTADVMRLLVRCVNLPYMRQKLMYVLYGCSLIYYSIFVCRTVSGVDRA